VIAKPTFVRSPDAIVLGSIPGEHFDCAIIPLNRNGDFVDVSRVVQSLDDVRVDIEMVRGPVEL
jgi:hypothetical protein